ncbi:LiaF transmembrane domain-containing protein [Rosettibacter firmus]|uniref:LiaF transmembrane domain-containing protein n=1 Tax=Rosettibacter firmus TaxID=3111522 RepID=UPI00336BD220
MAYYIRTRIVIGLILVLIGLIFILNNYGIELIPEELLTWEYLLILFGILLIILSKNNIAGIIFIAIGLFSLLPELWPLIFVIIGIMIIFRKKDHEKYYWKFHTYKNHTSSNTEERLAGEKKYNIKETIEEISIFGGSTKILHTDNFRGGNIISIFGGSEINFLDCKLAEGENVLEITAIFGGSTIIVPSDWYVEIDILPIFGGFSDNRIKNPSIKYEENKKLLIKGFVLFGGGEIKNTL